MDSWWPMFSGNSLMSYPQDLELGPYFFEMETGDRSRVAQVSHQLFCKIIMVAQTPVLHFQEFMVVRD